MELLKETFPKMTRMAYLWSKTTGNLSNEEANKATHGSGVQLISYEAASLGDIERAFAEMRKAQAQAILVAQSPVMTLNSKRIVELAIENRLPGIYPTNQFAEEGGLIAYGPVITDLYRRAATYVDKILKGAKPAELPIEQPTRFELIINLKTANQVGVTVPANVLARADRVIR